MAQTTYEERSGAPSAGAGRRTRSATGPPDEAAGATSEQAKELAGTVKAQVSRVGSQLTEEGRSMVEEARTQLAGQAESQVSRLSERLRDLGDEIEALAEGRPDDAPTLQDYLYQAADALADMAERVDDLAADYQTRGVRGVVDDVQSFARRRPTAFLVGTAIAGFGIGRLIRSGKDDGQEEALPASRGAGGRRQVGGRRQAGELPPAASEAGSS